MPQPFQSILFLTPSDKTGGGNRVVFHLASLLSAGHRVTVAYPAGRKGNTFTISPAVRLRPVGLAHNGALAQLLNIMLLVAVTALTGRRYDRIVATGPVLTPLLFLITGSRLYNFIQADDVVIYDDRSLIRSGPVLAVYKAAIISAYRCRRVRFLFNSRYTYDRFIRHSGRTDVPCALVQPGVDAAVFRPAARARPPRRLTVALMARHHGWKGLATFTQAFELLDEAARRSLDVVLITHDSLCGQLLPGAWNVLRPASDRDIARFLQSADIFVSPSWWEGFGLPALEAMACGCAVITSDNGGCREYAVPGRNCLAFPPRDAPALKRRLDRLIRDAVLRRDLSRSGPATAVRFSWERTARQLLESIGG